jgi:tetratricopeptide (TPR) repeat protein
LEKAVTHIPDLTEAHELITRLCTLPDGDRKKGLKAANELVRLAGDDKSTQATAYLTRARFEEKSEEQLADLDRAAELDPENREALQLRAALLMSQQRFDDAANTLRELLKRDDNDPRVHLALAEVLVNIEGKFDESMQEVTRSIELDPKSAAAYIFRARMNTSQDNLDAALSDLDEALKIDENDIAALLFRAEIYLARDNFKAAREDIDKSLRVRPNLVLGIMMRSRVNAAEERYEEAIADMESLVEHDPQNVDFRLQLASYYNAAERPRKAVKLLTALIDEDQDNWRALRARGDALLSFGQHADAVSDYNKALELNKEDSGLLNNLAWVLATSPEDNLRDGARAIELATKACELTEYKQAHILSTLASGYAETGDFETAIKWSTKAVEIGEGEMKKQLQDELQSYQNSKPWREKQETAEKPEIPKRDLLET